MPEHIETGKYLHAIAHSDQYSDYRQRATLLERTQSQTEKVAARKRAISMGALALANDETKESGFRTPEGTIFSIIGRIDAFSHARTVLSSQKNLSREQERAYKTPIIEFNHALKEAIDSNPGVGFNSMLRMLQETYASLNGTANINIFTAQAREVLIGMQHEHAAEQIIGITTGYEVDYEREVGIDQELDGIDLYVRDLSTGESFGVDFKASEGLVERARRNAFDYHDNPDKYVWSQCGYGDFDNSFTIAADSAKEKAHGMKAYLDRASHTAHRDPSRQLAAVA